MNVLQQLRSLDAERVQLDELVYLHSQGTMLAEGYTKLDLEVPEFVENGLKAVKTEIERRRREILDKEIRETEAALAALETNAEKRQRLQAKLGRLKGNAPATATASA